MLDENGDGAGLHPTGPNNPRHLIGDLIGALAVGANIELVLMNVHKLCDPKITSAIEPVAR